MKKTEDGKLLAGVSLGVIVTFVILIISFSVNASLPSSQNSSHFSQVYPTETLKNENLDYGFQDANLIFNQDNIPKIKLNFVTVKDNTISGNLSNLSLAVLDSSDEVRKEIPMDAKDSKVNNQTLTKDPSSVAPLAIERRESSTQNSGFGTSGFLEPLNNCADNGEWCSCYYGCSTPDCCSGACEGYTCLDYGCYPDYPNSCGGSCWATCSDPNYPHWNCKSDGTATCCASGYPYYCERTGSCWSKQEYCNNAVYCGGSWRVCTDTTDVPTCYAGQLYCCPSSHPYYCYKTGTCWNTEYLPNPCGSGCPSGQTECNGNCYTCSSGTLCCPSSGSPSWCCGSNQICQSDGTCLTPECTVDSDCSSDGYYCSGDNIMFRNYYCSNYQCKYSDSLYKDCNDNNQWYCLDADTRAYADYTCGSSGCEYTATNQQDCTYACSNGYCVTTTSVHGYMKYSDGSGVPNVKFKLENCNTGSTLAYDYTDNNGYYSINANAGNYVLSADYLGHDVDFTQCTTFYGDVTVSDITLSASLSGYVKYSDNSGRSGVIVRLKDCSGDNVVDSDTTDSNGYYYLSDPDAGYYKVTMELYGSEFEVFSCQAMLPGMRASDIVFNARLSGYIEDSGGNGKSGIPVRLADCNGNTIDTESTNSNGYFMLESADAGKFDFYLNYLNQDIQALDCKAIVGNAQFSNPIVLSASLSGYIHDSSGNGKFGVPVRLAGCNGNTIDTDTTNSNGYFKVESADAGKFDFYFTYLGYNIQALDCKAIVGNAQFSNPIVLETTVHGYLKDLNNNPLQGYDVELYDCSENFIASDETSSSGYFSITEDAEKYKIMINMGGWKIKLVDQDNNDCLFLLGDINLGTLNINPTPDCSVFNYMCYGPDKNIKLFNCYWNDYEKGCFCYGQECLYGCTDGAQECDSGEEGTIHVDVDNINDNYNPLPGAKVYLDDSYEGTTNSLGKKSLSAQFGYRNVKVHCSDDSHCGTQTVYVNGNEYVYFDCNCIVDSDSDDLSDADEELIGTNPNDPTENLNFIFSSPKIAKSCFDPSPIFSGIFSQSDLEHIVSTLNTSSQAEVENFIAGDFGEILTKAGISQQNLVNVNESFREIIIESDEVTGGIYQGYVVLFVTDNSTGITSGFGMAAHCTGNVLGLIFGAGYGLKDDFDLVTSIYNGLWYYATHVGEIGEIWGQVINFIKGIPQIFGHVGEIFHDMSMDIFSKGKSVNPWDKLTDRYDYTSFQMGFYEGYVVGYVTEQVVLVGKIGKAIQSFNVGAELGKIGTKGTELLAKITTKFGGKVADIIRKTKIWASVKIWGDDTAKSGIGRLAKYLDDSKLVDDFLKNVDDAKALTKKIDDVAVKHGDNVAETLVKSEYGVKAFKVGWSVDELAGLYKIINLYGEEFVEKLVRRYGDDVVEITSKGVEKNVINLNEVNPEKLAVYIRGIRIDPTDIGAGEEQLVRMLKAPGRSVKAGNEIISDTTVIKVGKNDYLVDGIWKPGFGKKHIKFKHIDGHVPEPGTSLFPEGMSWDEVEEMIKVGLKKGTWDTTDPTKIIFRPVDYGFTNGVDEMLIFDKGKGITTAFPTQGPGVRWPWGK